MQHKPILSIFLVAVIICFSSCKKLLDIPAPIDSITTEEIFANNQQAEWAIAGMYSKMVYGIAHLDNEFTGLAFTQFASGLSTIMGGLSADELRAPATGGYADDLLASYNKINLKAADRATAIWNSAYQTIFDANAVIDGIAASESTSLIDSVRKQLTGEALAIRAFCHFYLVNFFGDIPIVLTSDFKKSQTLSRSPVSKVYDQIKTDLVNARSMLAKDYSVSKGERTRVNSWFAEALLARVYLYTGEYQNAITSAGNVIAQSGLYAVQTDLTQTFLANNGEAIFQLQTSEAAGLNNATPEGYVFTYRLLDAGSFLYPYRIAENLIGAFEPGDKRKLNWTKTEGPSVYPAKYSRGQPFQYYMVMRLSELHLIRAEATVLLSPAAKQQAIDDLNVLRRRAGVDELDNQLTAAQVSEAIAHERQVELFLEWGHRWFDLKRTGKAESVLSAISYKQPWLGNYQLVYPLPPFDLENNSFLVQNPQYESR
ncbi:RagB/SusD family nutrient uptake outer membrane protein [Pseudobacter ginsenosidimutans]|uniref:SusD-like starch-binding protein associating with outer membrane n=1 Tax=Pseudobacter ginsenosidimutans TaxID=661488 RepID=A0A4V2F257_9BACT|nr:RagB/SusD family nutrient uptake outer membrane protein [Pseudobacter ginsenosidimutans]QEC44636.1 RagB/SusD family nutrient uptake outer membrane protein [Pseudobacter ginsenosidimutans]RZS76117.1 SusD-like starch-binding protein associating with outer membrane [Pseudobacter ginsenosidimutans]